MYLFYLASTKLISNDKIFIFLRQENKINGYEDISYLTEEQLNKISTPKTIFGMNIEEGVINCFCIAFILNENIAHVTFLCIRRDKRKTGLLDDFITHFKKVSIESSSGEKTYGLRGYSFFTHSSERKISKEQYLFDVNPWVVDSKNITPDDSFAKINVDEFENFHCYENERGEIAVFFQYTSTLMGVVHSLVHCTMPISNILNIGLGLISGSNLFNYEYGSLGETYGKKLSLYSSLPIVFLKYLF